MSKRKLSGSEWKTEHSKKLLHKSSGGYRSIESFLLMNKSAGVEVPNDSANQVDQDTQNNAVVFMQPASVELELSSSLCNTAEVGHTKAEAGTTLSETLAEGSSFHCSDAERTDPEYYQW